MSKGNFNPFGKIIAAGERVEEIQKRREDTYAFIRETKAKRFKMKFHRVLPTLDQEGKPS